MATKYWILILCALLVLCGISGFFLLAPGEDAAFAAVYSQGDLVRYVDLSMDQVFTVDTPEGGRNEITVRDGRIAVTEASCPDHYCAQRGFCAGGAQIVCLPNKLVIKFEGKAEVDMVVG